MKTINIADVPNRNKLTTEPILLFKKIKYKQNWLKPKGIWYGLKHYWLDYYTNNYERKQTSKFKYNGFIYKIKITTEIFTTINLPNKNKILLIKSIKDLKAFEQLYYYKKITKTTNECQKFLGEKVLYINWNQVTKDFGGIEINYNPWSNGQFLLNDNYKNYLPFWYSLWDVPSGCIWSYDLLKQIKFILL
jgi:hypothetical protein